ncbi:MAG: alpha/beta hydrolase-fold protein [Porphyromonas sp.]|nr:alpha/beta hydrolase-fold protein [Porphyromonas sp.]
MKKIKILFATLLLLCCALPIHGQQGYNVLIEQASELMYDNADSAKYRKAMQLFDDAFRLYPDSVNVKGLYHASVLAGRLNLKDRAFSLINRMNACEKDDFGLPGWTTIYWDKEIEKEYPNLIGDTRWSEMLKDVERRKALFDKRLALSQKEFFASEYTAPNLSVSSQELYKYLQDGKGYLPKKERNYSIKFRINDSTLTSYYVHLPADYSPKQSYPLLVVLHGAVRNNSLLEFLTSEICLEGFNRFYTKYANQHGVILLIPQGSKEYNWMMPDKGFFMVPSMVREVKKALNVDDDRVFVSGHSNGATGSFSYLMKQPTIFAGFYGFNTLPKVRTGGTFAENILNRSFLSFSTDQDYYYPPNANDSMNELMSKLGADYKDVRTKGFPHWFPMFDESEPCFRLLFEDLIQRQRNPYPSKLTWEYDDEQYNEVDWLSDIRMDTIAPRADWHKDLNFDITEWQKYDDNEVLQTIKVEEKAFQFPRKSAKIRAEYEKNTFRIETSCVKSFRINISPKMIDTKKPVTVVVNGKRVFRRKVGYDKNYLLRQIEKQDRKQVWISGIDIRII